MLREPWTGDWHRVGALGMAAASDPHNNPWGGGALIQFRTEEAEYRRAGALTPVSLTPKAGL